MYLTFGWHFFNIVTPDPHNIGAHLCQESKHVWDAGTFCNSCFLRCLKHSLILQCRKRLNARVLVSVFCCSGRRGLSKEMSGCIAALPRLTISGLAAEPDCQYRIPAWVQSHTNAIYFHCWGWWGQREPRSVGTHQCKSMQWVVPIHLHWSAPQD